MGNKINPKTTKVDIYYYDNNVKKHVCTEKLLWCYIRDTSLSEKSNYMSVLDENERYVVGAILYINYNPRLLELWKHGEKHIGKVYASIRDRTYEIVAKPDEFEHNRGDMKVLITERDDTTTYVSEVYLESL